MTYNVFGGTVNLALSLSIYRSSRERICGTRRLHLV